MLRFFAASHVPHYSGKFYKPQRQRHHSGETMLVSHEREKMINAIIYFANHTRHLCKIKLFKLLYLLDFEHFRQTGRSVTGLDYRAWKFGPVPVALE